MKNYISGVRSRLTFMESPLLIFSEIDCYFGNEICQLALNGSDKYESYTGVMVKRLMDEGYEGIMKYGDDEYVIYRVSKSGLALMSTLKYCDTLKKIPRELYFQFSSFLLVSRWKIPVYMCNSGNVCLFDNMDQNSDKGVDCSYLPSLILQYYKTSTRLGNMLDYNIDMLSGAVVNALDWCLSDKQPLSGSFYYNGYKEFRGSSEEFGKNGYIDCNINPNEVYRLHKSGVFQYIGCPLYIDRDDYLYLGFFSSNDIFKMHLSGAVKYKIIDRKKFDSIVTKSLLIGDLNYIDMCNYDGSVEPSKVRVKG